MGVVYVEMSTFLSSILKCVGIYNLLIFLGEPAFDFIHIFPKGFYVFKDYDIIQKEKSVAWIYVATEPKTFSLYRVC
jgi:hypothetical protein